MKAKLNIAWKTATNGKERMNLTLILFQFPEEMIMRVDHPTLLGCFRDDKKITHVSEKVSLKCTYVRCLGFF